MVGLDLGISVLGPDLNFIGMIEAGRNESFIWTDRYLKNGDCKFTGEAGTKNLSILQPGNFLSIPHSPRLMLIESHLNQTVVEQGAKLQISALSADTFLKTRPVPNGYTPTKKPLSTIVYELLQATIGTGAPAADRLTNVVIPAGGLGPQMEVEFTSGSNVYDVIMDLCGSVGYGFKWTFSHETATFFAEVYSGLEKDLLFSPAMDTLANVSYLNSISGYYNLARVIGKNHTLDYGPGVGLSGFNRRILRVDATGIETTAENYQEKLGYKGAEALASAKRTTVFDGQIDPNGIYDYGTDYNLGDIVTISDSYGNSSRSRVVEFIWSYDANGVQTYPSFEAYTEPEI